MSPKKSSPAEIQGSFFQEIEEHSGTDPELHKVTTSFEPAPDGVYTDPAAPEQRFTTLTPETEKALTESVHEANKTRNRHLGQLAKHTTLDAKGKHTDVVEGKYLPGFGPVTTRNLEEAKRYAEQLDKKR